MFIQDNRAMKPILLSLLLAFAGTAQSLELAPLAQQGAAAHLSAELLQRYHYRRIPLDDQLSGKIFEQYLQQLDSEKMFFTQADIERMNGARTRLDDALENGDLRLPFLIFNLYSKRVVERFRFAKQQLDREFDFTLPESLPLSREKADWAAAGEELDDLWRKRVKNDWLRLRLAGKASAEIAQTLGKRYDASIRRIERIGAEDAFQLFMNAYTTSIDPHTNYLGPRASENFDISMRLSLVGIGAVLEERDEYTTVRELMPGGPAAISGQLKVGDRIVGVAQNRDGNLVDVLGWRLDDTVQLIRGQANTEVQLEIIPSDGGPDAAHRRIKLIRQKISLEEQAAKKSVLPLADGRKIGVITLSSFYRDFAASQNGKPDYSSAARDVAALLAELRKAGVDGILVDLRGNGGGALSEAVALTGLFIDRGPVVQQRDAKGHVAVENDNDPGTAWNGPLGVLINRESASASEIFAAAIQDYGRGLIIGEQSFGKGTVQSVVDLDNFAVAGAPKLGTLKMTVSQFFRINGGTTQLRGVLPDIAIPGLGNDDKGESAFPNALPWNEIAPARKTTHGPWSAASLANLQASQKRRLENNEEFKLLQEAQAKTRVLRDQNRISLNEEERRRERLEQAQWLQRRQAAKALRGEPAEGGNTLFQPDDGLEGGERKLSEDLARKHERETAPDFILGEAASILGDAILLAH